MKYIVLKKLGRNCNIQLYDTSNQIEIDSNYFEDSSNIDINYNFVSNIITISIKGNTRITSEPVNIGNDVFYIDLNDGNGNQVVTDFATFSTLYAQLFLNGGSGPITTPTLQEVVTQGNKVYDDNFIQIGQDTDLVKFKFYQDGIINEYIDGINVNLQGEYRYYYLKLYNQLNGSFTQLNNDNDNNIYLNLFDGVSKFYNEIRPNLIKFTNTVNTSFYSEYSPTQLNFYSNNFGNIATLSANSLNIGKGVFNGNYAADGIKLTDNDGANQLDITNQNITFSDLGNVLSTTITNPVYNNQILNLPETSGKFALQNAPSEQVDLNIGPFTPVALYEKTFVITGSGNNILLSPSNFNDKITIKLCVQNIGPFKCETIDGGFLYGNENITQAGLYFIHYDIVNLAFYINN
jgi:hypothetical protein